MQSTHRGSSCRRGEEEIGDEGRGECYEQFGSTYDSKFVAFPKYNTGSKFNIGSKFVAFPKYNTGAKFDIGSKFASAFAFCNASCARGGS